MQKIKNFLGSFLLKLKKIITPKRLLLSACFVFIIFSIYQIFQFLGNDGGTISNVRITNLTPNSASITWTTTNQTVSEVVVKDQDFNIIDNFNLPSYYDQRDLEIIDNEKPLRLTHIVTISGLDPGKKYHFGIKNKGKIFADQSNTFTTYSNIEESIKAPDPLYGSVKTYNNSKITEAVLNYRIQNKIESPDQFSEWKSTTATTDRGWTADIGLIYNKEGKYVSKSNLKYFAYEVVTELGNTFGVFELKSDPSKMPDIFINEFELYKQNTSADLPDQLQYYFEPPQDYINVSSQTIINTSSTVTTLTSTAGSCGQGTCIVAQIPGNSGPSNYCPNGKTDTFPNRTICIGRDNQCYFCVNGTWEGGTQNAWRCAGLDRCNAAFYCPDGKPVGTKKCDGNSIKECQCVGSSCWYVDKMGGNCSANGLTCQSIGYNDAGCFTTNVVTPTPAKNGEQCRSAGGSCGLNISTCQNEGGTSLGAKDCNTGICCKISASTPTPTPTQVKNGTDCKAQGGSCGLNISTCNAEGGSNLGAKDCNTGICCKISAATPTPDPKIKRCTDTGGTWQTNQCNCPTGKTFNDVSGCVTIPTQVPNCANSGGQCGLNAATCTNEGGTNLGRMNCSTGICCKITPTATPTPTQVQRTGEQCRTAGGSCGLNPNTCSNEGGESLGAKDCNTGICCKIEIKKCTGVCRDSRGNLQSSQQHSQGTVCCNADYDSMVCAGGNFAPDTNQARINACNNLKPTVTPTVTACTCTTPDGKVLQPNQKYCSSDGAGGLSKTKIYSCSCSAGSTKGELKPNLVCTTPGTICDPNNVGQCKVEPISCNATAGQFKCDGKTVWLGPVQPGKGEASRQCFQCGAGAGTGSNNKCGGAVDNSVCCNSNIIGGQQEWYQANCKAPEVDDIGVDTGDDVGEIDNGNGGSVEIKKLVTSSTEFTEEYTKIAKVFGREPSAQSKYNFSYCEGDGCGNMSAYCISGPTNITCKKGPMLALQEASRRKIFSHEIIHWFQNDNRGEFADIFRYKLLDSAGNWKFLESGESTVGSNHCDIDMREFAAEYICDSCSKHRSNSALSFYYWKYKGNETDNVRTLISKIVEDLVKINSKFTEQFLIDGLMTKNLNNLYEIKNAGVNLCQYIDETRYTGRGLITITGNLNPLDINLNKSINIVTYAQDNEEDTVYIEHLTQEEYDKKLNEMNSTVSLTSGYYPLNNRNLNFSEKNIFTNNTKTVKFFIDENSDGIKQSNEKYLPADTSIVSASLNYFDYTFTQGWNPISFNFSPSEFATAEGFIKYLNTNGIDARALVKYSNGQFVNFVMDDEGNSYADNFNLQANEGYFVRVNEHGGNVRILGNLIEQNTISLNNGWNLVTIANSAVSDAENFIEKCIAGMIECNALADYKSGLYEILVKDSGTYFGNNFPLDQKKSYFVRVAKNGGKNLNF